MGCLVDSASAGWWVAKGNRGGLGKMPERGSRKEPRVPDYIKRWGAQGFGGVVERGPSALG